ncbi:MAG: arsenic resistance N-acetyltransferase ArsN2 [Gammaproteobacteria bacterium]|nr:arsenic resistance N-acetyltransferase ArsN2 [Gammaproteobacteria bacterium]
MSGQLRKANGADLPAIEGLLGASALPVDGVRDNLVNFFVYENNAGALLGVVGMELYGKAGLLRSTVVVESARGQGIAAKLIDRAVAHAREKGCNALYLLTLDADRYFKRFGFSPIAREDAPPDIRSSAEFTTLCPDSAMPMKRRLGELS